MSNTTLKIKGTQNTSFDIGFSFKLDASNIPSPYTWVLPGNNGISGYVLTNDGNGNLYWSAGGGGSGGDSTVPYYLYSGDTFTVNIGKQALFTIPITVDGTLAIDGILIEV